MKLLCHTRIASLITAIGSVPLFVYAFSATARLLPVEFAQLYLYSVLAFIAGINWITALQENDWSMLLWSIVLSLLPLVSMISQYFDWLSHTGTWLAMLMLLWLALAHDYWQRAQVDLTYFFCFRRSGTVFLSIAIICILVM